LALVSSVTDGIDDRRRSRHAFTYLGFEERDERGLDGVTWQGGIRPHEAHDFHFRVGSRLEYVRAWTLVLCPSYLVNEVERSRCRRGRIS
jgi:hypothetical protein